MLKKKIMTSLAAAALCLTVYAAPAGSCIQRSCTDRTCVTVSASDKCCTKNSSCSKGHQDIPFIIRTSNKHNEDCDAVNNESGT